MSPDTPSLPRRRLRSQPSEETLETAEESDLPPDERLGQRIQELLQLYERSRTKHGEALLPMRYVDLNAIVEGRMGEEDINNSKLVTRMSHEGIFYCFRIKEGWTPMPFATQLFPAIPSRLVPSLDSMPQSIMRGWSRYVLRSERKQETKESCTCPATWVTESYSIWRGRAFGVDETDFSFHWKDEKGAWRSTDYTAMGWIDR